MTDPEPGKFAWTPDAETIADSKLTAFLKASGASDFEELLRRSGEDPEWFWDSLLRFIGMEFYQPYTRAIDVSRGEPWPRWCVGGTTNVVLNCLDKHMATSVRDQQAISWEGEDGKRRAWTYAELNAEVCRFAGGLRELGFGRGDVIALYTPFLPEAVAALLAIAKIGGIVQPLFSGFGVKAVADRMNDAGAVGVITADGTLRRGKRVALKPVIDEAAAAIPTLRKVVTVRNLGDPVRMVEGRDHWWHELREHQPEESPTEEMEADAPCLLVYTSGTTGRSKGCVLTHVGFLAKVSLDLGICMNFKAGDRIMWMSDMGWVVGPLMAFGATGMGGTKVIAEGGPDYPEPGRMWRLVQDHRVTCLGVAPTIIRAMMRDGVEELNKYDLSSVRNIVSTGEAWNPDSWLWLFHNVGKGKLPIHNLTGGTEVGGGILTTTVHHPLKPGSFAGPVPGTGADIVDAQGNSLPPGQLGELVMRQASIGSTRGLWKDEDGSRYLDAYWNRIPGVWVQGDFAYRDEDGLWFVTGRSDDVFNVAGKRVGPSEVESLLMDSGRAANAAVVGVPDEIKGEAVVCVVVPAEGETPGEALTEALSEAVVAGLGKPFRPREILYVSDLPKTRNMKVMRRLVRSVYAGDPPGDTASLVNPEVVEELQQVVAESRET